jgi:LuxR family transcriptional regulator, activator of conjugal transfer of Ti plasmids
MMKLIPRRTPTLIHLVPSFRGARLVQPSLRRAPTVAGMTPAELEVLMWLSLGKRTIDIAMIMTISRNSVIQHTHRLRTKLGASTVASAVAMALRRNIIE